MPLSSFTQYYIRKLLREHLKNLNGRIPCALEINRYFHVDLNLILKELCVRDEAGVVARKIEILIQAHHEQKISGLYEHPLLFKLEQEIFELLGLRLYSSVPVVLLKTVEEKAAASFVFLLQSRLYQGLRYQKRIYGLVLEAKLKHDPHLHQLISVLLEQEVDFLVTVSPTRHAVWINLQSPAYVTLITYGFRLLNKAVLLKIALRRFKGAQPAKQSQVRF